MKVELIGLKWSNGRLLKHLDYQKGNLILLDYTLYVCEQLCLYICLCLFSLYIYIKYTYKYF